jgi:carbonic anhydrase
VGQFFIANGGLGNIYKTAQFHFHWGKHSNRGSEHTIDGKRAPLEVGSHHLLIDRILSCS